MQRGPVGERLPAGLGPPRSGGFIYYYLLTDPGEGDFNHVLHRQQEANELILNTFSLRPRDAARPAAGPRARSPLGLPRGGAARPALRLLGAARRGGGGFGGGGCRPGAADRRAAGRRVRAGAARWPAPLPAPAGGHVVMRRLQPRRCPSAAASRRPDGAAARAAVRRCHRAGLRLPRRPQSHLQVMAEARRDRGTRGPAEGKRPPGPSWSATPCARSGRASPRALWSGSLRRRAGPGGVRSGRSRGREEGVRVRPRRRAILMATAALRLSGGASPPAQRWGDTGPSQRRRAGAGGAGREAPAVPRGWGRSGSIFKTGMCPPRRVWGRGGGHANAHSPEGQVLCGESCFSCPARTQLCPRRTEGAETLPSARSAGCGQWGYKVGRNGSLLAHVGVMAPPLPAPASHRRMLHFLFVFP